MGIGHHRKNSSKQGAFFNLKLNFSHGGELRKKRKGRGPRPLSAKEPIHVVFKVAPHRLRHKSLRAPQSFKSILEIIEKYAKHFAVKIEQLSVQNDHVHLLIRTSRRKHYHHFFRVVAGQIAQRFEKAGLLTGTLGVEKLTARANLNQKVTGTPQYAGQATSLWKYRPFSRVVTGWKSYKIIRNYIQLNEKEALAAIKYQKGRLSGLSTADWQILWA